MQTTITPSRKTQIICPEKGQRRKEENTDRSPLDKGYWNGMGEHNRLNAKKYETGGSEVVDITFARDSEQPPDIETSKDDNALESGSDSIAVWTGTVWLITMRLTNNTLGNNTKKMGTLERGEDISPEKGIEDKVSYGSSEILQICKELIQGDQCADIKTIEHRTCRGCRMNCEEDHLEWGREQRNVTKDMDSFDPKPAQAEVYATIITT